MVGCGLGGNTASWALGGVMGPTSRPPSIWVKGGQEYESGPALAYV